MSSLVIIYKKRNPLNNFERGKAGGRGWRVDAFATVVVRCVWFVAKLCGSWVLTLRPSVSKPHAGAAATHAKHVHTTLQDRRIRNQRSSRTLLRRRYMYLEGYRHLRFSIQPQ